jgi:hypothetical protein
MNDRIQELVVEACKPNAVFKKYIGNIDCGMLMRDEELERFAELIIQECAKIGEIKEQGFGDYDPNISVGWYMRKHFGVE